MSGLNCMVNVSKIFGGKTNCHAKKKQENLIVIRVQYKIFRGNVGSN